MFLTGSQININININRGHAVSGYIDDSIMQGDSYKECESI